MVDGIPVYRYKFELDKEQLLKFMNEQISSQLPDESEGDYRLDFSSQILSGFLEFINFTDAEVWIGKSDFQLYKIALAVEFKPPSGTRELTFPVPGLEKLSFSLTSKNYNQPVNIAVPSPVISFEEALSPILKVLPGGLPFPGGGTGMPPGFVDTDKDGLSDEDETLLWKTDPKNPDTDKDGFNDGTEVKNGFNPKGPGKLSF